MIRHESISAKIYIREKMYHFVKECHFVSLSLFGQKELKVVTKAVRLIPLFDTPLQHKGFLLSRLFKRFPETTFSPKAWTQGTTV